MSDTAMSAIDLFLLPHQDDEFAAFHLVATSIASGRSPGIVYLTDGAYGRASATTRNAESLHVLKRLGVGADNIVFLGQAEAIPNQGLQDHIQTVYGSLLSAFGGNSQFGRIQAIYTTAWEGGHPDHDAAALAAVALGQVFGLSDRVFQFPLYSSHGCRLLPYTVFRPNHDPHPPEERPIPLRDRLRYLRYCWLYPSQFRTFVGLFPFILKHYVAHGVQYVQRLDRTTLNARPHPGPLLYEKRGWQTWQDFEKTVAAFREEHGLTLTDPTLDTMVAANPSRIAAQR